jgi:uncharacterized membrane protein YjdF
MKRFILLFAVMLSQYFLLVVNFRAVARGSYLGTGVTDLILAFNSFSLIKWVGESENNWEKFAYVSGGFVGSLVALWASIHVFKQ